MQIFSLSYCIEISPLNNKVRPDTLQNTGLSELLQITLNTTNLQKKNNVDSHEVDNQRRRTIL